jgi:hypothetical protein
MTPQQVQAELSRMVDQARLVQHQLATIEHQIRRRALNHVAAVIWHPRRSTSTHPGHTGWRVMDTLELERVTPAIEASREPEIRALQARLNRQRAAIEALIARHRLNVDPAELLR